MALAGKLSPAEYERVVAELRQNDPAGLAPVFRKNSDAAIAECVARGFDVVSFECLRSNELADLYFEHHVSKAPNALLTWHHYGLARDVISSSRGWDVYPDQDGAGGDPDWYRPVHEIARAHGMDLGFDWPHFHDAPHWQHHGMKATPSRIAIDLLTNEGVEAVWRAVGAI